MLFESNIYLIVFKSVDELLETQNPTEITENTEEYWN